MQSKYDKIPKVAIGLSLLIFIAIVLVFVRQTKTSNVTSSWITHTQEVLFQSERLYSNIIESETSSRGYLLTGQAFHLKTFDSSKNRLKSSFDTLRTLTADNLSQQARVSTLLRIVTKRILYADSAVQRKKNSEISSYLQLVTESRGDLYFDEVREISAKIQQEEYYLLQVRNKAGNNAKKVEYIVFLTLIFCMLILVVLLFSKEKRHVYNELEKKSALISANKELTFQKEETESRATELSFANEELAYQNEETENRAAELSIANEELALQNREKEKRATELAEMLERVSFLASIADNIQDPVISTISTGNNNSIITRWNKPAEKLFGWTSEEVIGKDAVQIFKTTFPYETREQIFKLLNEFGFWQGEVIYYTKSGCQVHALSTVSFLKDNNGNVTGNLVLIRDISARKKAEEALCKLNEDLEQRVIERTREIEKNEKRFRALTENNYDIIGLMDASFKIVYRSPSAFRITGWTNKEIEQLDSTKLMHPDDVEKASIMFLELMAKPGKPVNTLFRNLHKKGHYLWMEGTVVNLLADENVKGIIFNFRDITESKKAAERIAEALEEKNSILESIGDAFFAVDNNWTVNYWNRIAEKDLGVMKGEIIGKNLWEVFSKSINTLSYQKYHEAVETNLAVSFEDHYPALNTWFEISAYPSENGLSVFFKDISERKRAAEKIKESEIRYRLLIEHASDSIFIVDASMKYIDVNPAGCLLTGYSKDEMLKLSRHDLGFEEDPAKNPLRGEKLKKGEAINYERKIRRKDGSSLEVEVSAKMMEDERVVIFARDITERNREKFQKMLLAEISRSFNEPGNLADILHKITKQIVLLGDFCMAEVWLIGKDGKTINITGSFSADENTTLFPGESAGIKSFVIGEGLPGVTWLSKQMECWRNIGNDKNIIWKEGDNKSGLKTAYGLPVFHNNEVTAVIIIGSDKAEQQNENFYTQFEDLSIHIGSEIKRKQLEQELDQMFNFAPDIICIIGVDGYFKKINPAACHLLEYTEEELLVIPFKQFIHPEDSNRSTGELATLSKGKIGLNLENRCITKSGKIKWLSWTTTPSPDEGLLFAIAKDITEKKELENLLNKSNALARIGSWEVDPVQDTVYWSDITRELHEASNNYVPTIQTAINFYKGDGKELINAKIKDAVELGIPWDLELVIITAKNNERWIRIIGETEFVNGRCTRLYGSFQDIDQRKRLTETLKKSEKLYRDLFENMLNGFAYCKAIMKNGEIIDYTYLSVNKEYENLIGVNNVTGKNFSEVSPGIFETNPNLAKTIKKISLRNERIKFETYIEQKNKWLSFSLYSVEKGTFVALVDNITEQKLASQKIHNLNAELEERVLSRTTQLQNVNKELESFSYSVSHDLRAPLRIIDGFGQILLEDYSEKLDEEGQQTISVIMSSARRMGQLIDDLLNFSKLGRAEMRMSEVNMNELVKDALLELAHSGVLIPENLTVHTLKKATGDSNLLKQVWINLVSNAIKYSRGKKEPVIEIGMKSGEDSTVYFVKDNGAGFNMQYADNLFGVFQRLHKEEEFTGTGVGLALVQRIIIRHEGKVWAEAKENRGATFYFTLPE